MPCSNVIFEWAQFHLYKQEKGESANDFITVLYNPIHSAAMGEMNEELIRHRLAVGLRDCHLSERSQNDPNFTLDITENIVFQSQYIKKQHTVLRNNLEEEPTVETVDIGRKNLQDAQKHQLTQTNTKHNGIQRGLC